MEQVFLNISLLFEFPIVNLKIIIDGVMIGALFALAAYGLALVWGVMNVKNLAQGDFVISGGYVYVFKDAFERANSMDKEKVRDAIAATDMKTFYGDIKFSEAGNNIAKPMALRQIQDGQYNVVAPTAFASSKLVWPRL